MRQELRLSGHSLSDILNASLRCYRIVLAVRRISIIEANDPDYYETKSS